MLFAVLTMATLLRLAPVDATRAACQSERVSASRCHEALAILQSESRARPIGLHADVRPDIGRVHGGVFWRRAVASGLLRPDRCEAHQSSDRGDGWGIRGAHGLAAAYSVHLIGECVAPEAVDVPFFSAVVTLRRLRVLERRYGLRTAEGRAAAWRVGVGGVRRAMNERAAVAS